MTAIDKMTKVDWTNAVSANGPKLAKWCEENYIHVDDKDTLSKWRKGRNPGFDTVDRLMCRNIRHVSELPDEVWLAKKQPKSAR